MDSTLVMGGVAGVVLLTTFALLLRSFISTPKVDDFDSVLPEVCVDKYKSMAGLFSSEDLEFLKSQPGFTPAMGRRFRSQRRQVMRSYLKGLKQDFTKLHVAAGHLLMIAPVDQSELAHELMLQRWLFTKELAIAHCNLCLDTFGLGNVQVNSLVANLSKVQNHYSNLSNAVVMNAA